MGGWQNGGWDVFSFASNPPNFTVAQGTQTRIENAATSSTSTATGNPGGSGVKHGPFGNVVADLSNFIDTIDPVMYFGYNSQGAGGAKVVPTEPSATWVLEADYNDGTSHRVEQYIEYVSPDGSITFRPYFFQYDRSITGAGNINNALTGSVVEGSVNGFRIQRPDGSLMAQFGPSSSAFTHNLNLIGNGGGALFLGDGTLTNDVPLYFNAKAGGFAGKLAYQVAGVDHWWLYHISGDGNLYLRDTLNAKMHVTFSPGAGTAGITDINSALKVEGNLGFYATTPVAKQTVSGAKGSNAALGSLMTALAALGLVTDSTTA